MIVRALLALVAVALFAGSLARPAAPATGRAEATRLAIVVPAGRPALRARAEAVVAWASSRPGLRAELRVPRSPTEQLGVTHALAVRGFAVVVGVGLDHRVAVAPVVARFAAIRFVNASAAPGALERAVARAVRR
jgi:hypothetical protein